VAECAKALIELPIRHLPMVEQDGALGGMVLDASVFAVGDIVAGMWVARRADLRGLMAADIAEKATTVTAATPLPDALDVLLASEDRAVVVVDAANRPLGIFTDFDAARLASALLPPHVQAQAQGGAEVHSAHPRTPIRDVLVKMEDHGVHHVPLRMRGQLVGMVSMRDLMREHAHVLRARPVGEVVGDQAVITGPAGLALREAAVTMAHHKVSCLPLVDQGDKLVGIVTTSDVVRALKAVV
jgi:CBS domain-containing protein